MIKKKIQDNIQITYDPKNDSFKNLKNLVLTAYITNRNFFKKDPPLITITFVYTRAQMNTILHRDTKDWEVGCSYNHKKQINQIAIFSPEVIETISNHTNTKINFSLVLTHEIAHIFTNNIFGFYYPTWLYEGLAGYIAKQYTKVIKIQKISDFSFLHDKENWNKNINYPQAYLFTKYLIDYFTEKKCVNFFELISKTLNRYHTYQEFKNTFEKFFKVNFDNFSSEWHKNK